MSDSESSEDEKPSPSGAGSDYTDDDDDGPSTSWGVKRRNKRPIISDSESEDDAVEGIVKEYAESCDSDSSGSAPGAETCAICLGRMRGEVGSPDACEHTFCKFCILEWAKVATNNPTCPQDRIPFTVVLVRKTLGGPIDKEVPVQKEKDGAEVIDLTDAENPTYCEVCNDCDREERLLLCDGCDLGYHLECLDPPLSQVPVEEWFCPLCARASVPDVLASKHGASSSRSGHERRGTSVSRRSSQQQEPRRIPRTRATERIRARIQKKKKKKRQRYKESKRAKVASGEVEDQRPPVVRLTELKHFVEGDNDVDAAHAEDRYAEQLLAGATHEASRQPSQRKADAAKLLRHVAFVPQASYSGRAKNKVIKVVNTQSENNGTDLLSGILENQTIAFSSAKNLVLTNERKLTKQPGYEVPCEIFQEERSLMSEPLPSQRKTPERSDDVESSSPSESSKSNLDKEVITEDDRPSNENTPSSHREGRHRSPFKSTYQHFSSYRKDYSYESSSKDNDHNRRPNDHNKDGHHYRREDEHNRSRYSPHSRHSSSWKSRSTYESSSSSSSSHHREKTTYSRNKEKDHREHSRQYESSSHQRHGLPEGRHGNRRSRDRSSSKYERSHDYKSHSSRSRKSHSKSKGESSHSSTTGERHIRSQWSFSYFNSENSFMNKTNGNHPVSSSNAQYGNESGGDVKVSVNKSIITKSISQETESTTSLTNSNGNSSSANETKSVAKHRNESNADNATYGKALPVHNTHSKEHQFSTMEENNVHAGQVIQEGSKNVAKMAKSDINTLKLVSHKEEQIHRKITIPDDSELDSYDIQGQTSSSSDNFPDISVESKSTEKCQLKSSPGKKTKMSALFGDFEDEVREDSVKRKHNEDDWKNQKEKDGKNTKSAKIPKKSKSKHLFGYDSDDDLASYTPHMVLEFSESKSDPSLPKKADGKNLNVSLQFDSKKDNMGCNTDNKSKQITKNLDVFDKKNHDINNTCHMLTKDSLFGNKIGTVSHEKHDVDEKRGKSHEKHGVDKKRGRSHEKHDVDEKQAFLKSLEKHDVNEKQAKSYEKHDVVEKRGKSYEKHDDENCSSMKMDVKKNGLGTKPMHNNKNVGAYNGKNEVSQESNCTSNLKNSVKSKQVNNISENSKSKEVELGKSKKTDSKLTQSKHKAKEKNKYGQEKRHGNSTAFSNLFGDIDDIESSSNSNSRGMELQAKQDCSNHLVKNVKKPEEKPITFEGKVNKQIEIQEDNPVAECSNNSNWMLNAEKVEDQNETDNKEFGTFGCYSASKHKSSSGSKQDNDLRIKQQKALLEVKVLQEVKKTLDPFYHNKSITKEEYKQIVAKCVKKVVTAECGDVIETEKIEGLVLAYVKLYKHRHMKLHT